MSTSPLLLADKKALIVGVANDRSLGWAIARDLAAAGCQTGYTYLNESLERRVRPLAASVGSDFIEPCDVAKEEDIDHLFEKIRQKWGHLDYLIHSVAFANRADLEGRFVNTSREGFLLAMNVSAYSLIALAKRAEPLMKDGGVILTLTYHGSQKVVPNYNVMGVAKAALEASVRYLAYDLGSKQIRVNAISAGPIKTLAAAGIRDFRAMLAKAQENAPLHETITGEDVGAMGVFLCGPGGRHITGTTMYLDSGTHIMGA